MKSKRFYFLHLNKIILTGYPVFGKIIGRISCQISIRYNPTFTVYTRHSIIEIEHNRMTSLKKIFKNGNFIGGCNPMVL